MMKRLSGIISAKGLKPNIRWWTGLFIIFLMAGMNNSSGFLFAQNGTSIIKGRVTNQAGQPLPNVTVRAIVHEGPYSRFDAITNANGEYQITGLDLNKYILKTLNSLGYLDEFYNNVYNQDLAEPIKVNIGAVLEGYDFELGRGGFISGRVMGIFSDRTEPLSMIDIHFLDAERKNERIGSTFTDSSGQYISPALYPSRYVVKVFGVSQNFVPIYWPDSFYIQNAELVEVFQERETVNIDFKLQATGSQITGHILDSETGEGIDSVWVVIRDFEESWVSQAWSDSSGFYRAGGLLEGKVKVEIYQTNWWKYRKEYYQNKNNFFDADTVSVPRLGTVPNIDFLLKPVATEIISNEFIEVAVTDKYPGTNLTIGTTEGLESPADDQQSLLNGHPKPVMSFTTIQIDTQNFRFGSNRGDLILPPTKSTDEKSITRVWEKDGIEVTQTTTLVQSTWSPLKREDTARLKYNIINKSNDIHSIGVRILFDTKLGKNDGAPIEIPAFKDTSIYEREYLQPDIPPWWTARAKDPTSGEIVFSAQGTLVGYGATPPDRFVIARYTKIGNTLWNYNPETMNQYTTDSAVAMWWNTDSVAPGETLEIITYYGLGEDTPDLSAPTIIQYIPEKEQREVHPDSSIRLVISDRPAGVDTTNIQIQINDQDAILKKTGDVRLLTLECTPQIPLTFNQDIKVAILNLQDQAPKPNKFTPETYYFYTLNDNQPPEIISRYPEFGAINIPSDTTMEIQLKDEPAGIDTTSIIFTVQGDTVVPTLSGTISELTLQYKLDGNFRPGERVDTWLKVSDLANSSEFLDDSSYFFIAFPPTPDTTAPVASEFLPANGDSNVMPRPEIGVKLIDDQTNIKKSEIKFLINSKRVDPILTPIEKGYQLRYRPALPFDFGTQVTARIQAEDSAVPPNTLDTSWTFTIIKDNEPPFLTDRHPTPFSTGNYTNTFIQFHIQDRLAGVDTNSVQVLVNNEACPLLCFEGQDSSEYKVSCCCDNCWNIGDTVWIQVSGADLCNPPNPMPAEKWYFIVDMPTDSIPPRITWHLPPKNAFDVSTDTQVMVEVADDGSGVDSSSIIMKINAQRVTPQIEGTPQNYIVRYDPTEDFQYNQQIMFTLSAADFAHNLSRDTTIFFTRVDTVPPFLFDFMPGDGDKNVSDQTKPSFRIRDNLAGVDTNAIKIEINNILAGHRCKIQSDSSYLVWYQPLQSFESGQEVVVKIFGQDRAGNSIDSTISYRISNTFPDLEILTLNTNPPQNLRMNVPFQLVTTFQAKDADIMYPFHLTFYQLNEVLGDTVFKAIKQDSIIEVRQLCHYPLGIYHFKVLVDSKDEVQEKYETNNIAEIRVEISEGPPIVKPNPFTPNGDNSNDQVKFDFTQLNLSEPELKIFSFEGREILKLNNTSNTVFSWDGFDSNGNPMPPGIYLYILNDNKKTVYKGYVVLAR